MKRSGPLQRKTPLRSRPPEPASAPAATRVRVTPAANPVRATMATPATLARPAAAAPKPSTHRSSGWLGAVRSLSTCVLCGAHGVEAAHRNEGKGGALKVHDCWTAALCRTCHVEIDQGKTMTREQRRAEIDRAIVLTLAQLVMEGKVGLR